MSLTARYAAESFVKTNPSREVVEARIQSLEEHSERLMRTQLCGMDGHARTVHMNATEIQVYRAYLNR